MKQSQENSQNTYIVNKIRSINDRQFTHIAEKSPWKIPAFRIDGALIGLVFRRYPRSSIFNCWKRLIFLVDWFRTTCSSSVRWFSKIICSSFDVYDDYNITYYFDQAKIYLIPFYNDQLVPLYNNQVIPLYNDQVVPLYNQAKDAIMQLTK